MKSLITIIVFAVFMSACTSTSTVKTAQVSGGERYVKLLAEAEEYYFLGMLSDAEYRYRKITEEYPDKDEAWLKLGNIYVRMGQLRAGVRAYTQCNQIKSDNIGCWNNLALARVKQSLATLDNGKTSFHVESNEYQQLELLRLRLISLMSSKK